MSIEIEKDIPLTTNPTQSPTALYPWRQMEVGDSFFVAGKTQANFGSHVFQSGKRLGKKFAVRTVEGGVRVWRTK